MAHPLVEVSRTRHDVSTQIVIEDYTAHPTICRSGIWVGYSKTFTETVVLSYEHDPEQLYVGWALNGTVVVDPGYSSGTPPWGAPVPGVGQITYNCPVSGLFHKISFTSTAGMSDQCVWVQVLYRTPSEAGAPFHYGPATSVCLDGAEVTWPADKLEAERKCRSKFFRDMLEVLHVKPGDPVENWLFRLRGELAVRIRAQFETLQRLDPKTEREFADALKADLTGILMSRMPGSGIAPGIAGKQIESSE